MPMDYCRKADVSNGSIWYQREILRVVGMPYLERFSSLESVLEALSRG